MQCAKSIVKGPVEHRHCPMCRAEIERVVNVGKKTIRWDSVDFVRCEDGVGKYLLFVANALHMPTALLTRLYKFNRCCVCSIIS